MQHGSLPNKVFNTSIQHEVFNTKYSTQSFQHEVFNPKYSTRRIQHEVFNTKYSTRSIQHEVFNPKPPPLMCYYNGIKLTQIQSIKLKNFEKAIADIPFLTRDLFNGFDYSTAPVLKRKENEIDFDVVEMEWGFLPPYLKTRDEVNRFRFGYKKENGQFQQPFITLNATSEEMLLPNKIFRDAALNRRCLILSTGFYEWRHVFPIGKKTGKPLKTAIKFPYHVGVKDKDYFFMAGIWQPWKDVETGEYVETFSIITTAANSLMEQVHNSRKRMPAILSEDHAWEWLLGNLTEEKISEIGRQQFPASEMEVCTVTKDFRNSLEPDAPFEYKELPGLSLEL